MRAYYFSNAVHGLAALRDRRLKVARISELNDPFELVGVELRSSEDRHFFQAVLRPEIARTIGALCFSRSWSNPVLWSHYADKHRGICLGFDVPDIHVHEVKYRITRLNPNLEHKPSRHDRDTLAYKLMTTKYKHWQYEDEVRLIFDLKDLWFENQRYFVPYCDALALREVIIGPLSDVQPEDIPAVHEPQDIGKVAIVRSHFSHRTYRVVRNLQGKHYHGKA